MRVADGWKDYELLDATGGERLERWGDAVLIRPDPQVVWKNRPLSPLWKKADAVYHRSAKGGGSCRRRRFRTPDFRTPDFRIPDFRIPDFRIPDFRIPNGKRRPPSGRGFSACSVSQRRLSSFRLGAVSSRRHRTRSGMVSL